MSYGRFWWKVEDKPPNTIYCSECNMALGESEPFVNENGNKYHQSCHITHAKRGEEHGAGGDTQVFIGLAVVVIGFFFA